MSEYHALALAALAQLQIRPPVSYSWYGTTSAPIAPAAARAMGPEVAREFLLYQLQQELYANFYCRGFPTPGERTYQRLAPLAAATFVERLARANRGRETSQPGWEVQGESEGLVIVRRDGLSLWVSPTQILPGKSRGPVSLRLPCELRKASPGFYLVVGETPIESGADVLTSDGADGATSSTDDATSGADGVAGGAVSGAAHLGELLRLYWHLTSAAAPKLLEQLTTSLNRRGIPFQLKVVNDPSRYDRCDAGVLYVARSHYEALAPVLGATYELLAGELRGGTPAFTKRLAPGLGLAEDPGDGQSFGMHRAALLAHAAVRAHELGYESEQERAGVLSETFAKRGLDIERPYLNAGSSDRYELLGQP
jgi:hypothetical protein